MQSQLVSRADAPVVTDRPRAPRVGGRAAWLQAALTAEAAPNMGNLEVTVRRGCGTVEVRVSGPGATLTLFFDPWELRPSEVQRGVRATIARYRSSLLGSAP